MTRGVKTKLTDQQWQHLEEYCKDGCSNDEIAAMMDIPDTILEENREIRLFIHKKRSERKRWLRKCQNKHTESTPVMSIFLGKNELGQADRQDMRHDISPETASLLGLIDGSGKGTLPNDEE